MARAPSPARESRALPSQCEGVTAPRGNDTVREMEAADWASLSDPELLGRRISKLGLRLEGHDT
jgi:hypothetical protein